MPRDKRVVKKRREVVKINESGEENDIPDPNSEEFYYDDVDKFHQNREKILLEKSGVSSDNESNSEEEVEEVLGLDLDSEESDDNENDNFYHENNEENILDDEEIIDSDDDNNTTKGIPSEKAWGRKKKVFYDVDDKETKEIGSEEEEILDAEEEEEALEMQERMAEKMDDEDFDMNDFDIMEEPSTHDKENKAKQETIVKDLSKMSKDEKLKLLAKDSPELIELVDDFKDRLAAVINFLQPLVEKSRAGEIENPKVTEYLETKQQITLNYLLNISFFLLLKAHQTSVKNHPVIQCLVQYRELLDKMKPLDDQLEDGLKKLLITHRKTNKGLSSNLDKKKPCKHVMFAKLEIPLQHAEKVNNFTRVSKKNTEAIDPLQYYENVRAQKQERKKKRKREKMLSQEDVIDEDDGAEIEDDGKRSITYQISKNKGLTPKRKKELRNPRVKHKRKFVKAKTKRKSQVLPISQELVRYGGETSGIKTHLTRGIKIK